MRLRLKSVIKMTGLTERQVRFLIAEGFVPPPRGGRSNAEYGEDHVEAIIRYTRLKELGFPPAAIRLLMGATAGIPFPIAKGVTLVVDTSHLASGADIEPMLCTARDVLARIVGKNPSQGSTGDRDV
jgi:MerR family copper efflux transcriptional regulator